MCCNKTNSAYIAESLLVFIGCWLVWSVWFRVGHAILVSGSGAAAVDALLVKGLVWGLPAVLLLKKKGRWLIEPQRLFAPPFPWLPLIVLSCLTAAFLHTVRLVCVRPGTVVLFAPIMILLSLCAGVYEELFFRGYLFNRQAAAIGVWKGTILNGLQFTLYHFPEILWGTGWEGLFSLRAVLLFSMGIVFCLVLKKWKNLSLAMCVHTIWDILSFWFGLSG